MRIVLADDLAIVREGVKHLLAAQPQLEVVAEVARAEDLSEITIKCAPDLLLLDFRLLYSETCPLVSLLKQQLPHLKVLVFTAVRSAVYLNEILESSIDGVVLKQDSTAELINAIRQVQQGTRYVADSVTKSLDEQAVDLTAREHQILNMIVKGLPRSQIAHKLAVSPETVKSHRRNLMKKLNVQTAMELAHKARALKL